MRSRALIAALLVTSPAIVPIAAEAAFVFSASGMADNALLPREFGCARDGGANRAPGFTWNDVPPGTKSFAIVGLDPDGGKGKGAVHILLYNLPGNATSIGSAQIAAHAFAAGALDTGDKGYRGPCPPAGDAPHHYIVTLYALDLAPSLPPDLDRDGLMHAIAGHSLDATSTILRYQATREP